jgi:nucleotide-binding universal stress UspA family protein
MNGLDAVMTGPTVMEGLDDKERPLAESNGHHHPMGYAQRFHRILVPIDLSEGSHETLRYALAFAEKADAMLDVLHVIHLNIAGEEQGIPRTNLIRQMSEAAQMEMRKLIETLLSGEIAATISVREGRPEEVILREAAAIKADLIVMKGQPRSLWARLFSPGVLQRVLRHAPCPVMVVGAGSEPVTPGNSRDSALSSEGRFVPLSPTRERMRLSPVAP